jgi:hypothetical protein
LVASLAALGLAALPVTAAHAQLVEASVNFGPTITGPENGTLIVTTPVTDATTDMTYTCQPGACRIFPAGACPGTSDTNAVSASLRIDAVPEPPTLFLVALALAGLVSANFLIRET